MSLDSHLSAQEQLDQLLKQVRACQICRAHLPYPPRPIVRAGSSAVLLIVGQAPGRRVHETGLPWNDPSGDRLRGWLGIDRSTFYDEGRIAIVPTGLCYPGTGSHGDLPPRKECAPLWHPPLRAALPHIQLILLIGSYAQAFYLGTNAKPSLSETVRAYTDYAPAFFPLPHPSPRNRAWCKARPWFEQEVVPALKIRVHALLSLW